MAAMRRARWVAAGLGRKPGKDLSLALLPSEAELPGGSWRRIDERTWRTGEADRGAEWAARARKLGSVTAWRSFECEERWLWVQASPLASGDDAALALHDLPSRFLRNLAAEVTVVESRDVPPPDLVGVSLAWAHEQFTTGPRGESAVRYLALRIGRVVGVACASGEPTVDHWSLLGSVGALVVDRAQKLAAQGDA